jgi:hypothetical protein
MGSVGYDHNNAFFARLGTIPAALGFVWCLVMFARAVKAGRRTPGD